MHARSLVVAFGNGTPNLDPYVELLYQTPLDAQTHVDQDTQFAPNHGQFVQTLPTLAGIGCASS